MISIMFVFILNICASGNCANKNNKSITEGPKTKIQIVEFKTPIRFGGKPRETLKVLDMKADKNNIINAYPGFEKDCDVVILPRRAPNEKKKILDYSIDWSNPATDGRLYLALYPNIIFLASGHDNPNPNSLLWYTFIEKKQYLAAVASVETMTKKATIITGRSESHGNVYYSLNTIYKHIPHWKITEIEGTEGSIAGKILADDIDNYMVMNLIFLIKSINTEISTTSNRLPVPTYEEMRNFKSIPARDGLSYLGTSEFSVNNPNKITVGYIKELRSFNKNLMYVIKNNSDNDAEFEFELSDQTRNMQLNIIKEERIVKAKEEKKYELNLQNITGRDIKNGFYYLKVLYKLGNENEKIESNWFRIGEPQNRKEIFEIANKYDLLTCLYYDIRKKQIENPIMTLTEQERDFVNVWDLNWILSYDTYIPGMCEDIMNNYLEIKNSLERVPAPCMREYFDKLLGLFPNNMIMKDRVKIAKHISSISDKNSDFYSEMEYEDFKGKSCPDDTIGILYKFVKENKDWFLIK